MTKNLKSPKDEVEHECIAIHRYVFVSSNRIACSSKIDVNFFSRPLNSNGIVPQEDDMKTVSNSSKSVQVRRNRNQSS